MTDVGLRERKKQLTGHSSPTRRGACSASEASREVSNRGQIARAADVSLATVFNYFPTKEDLMRPRSPSRPL